MALSEEYGKVIEEDQIYEAHRGGKIIATALVLPNQYLVCTRMSDKTPVFCRFNKGCKVYELKQILCNRFGFATEGLGFRLKVVGGCVNNYSIDRSHHLKILKQRDELKTECHALHNIIKDMRAAAGDKPVHRCPQDGRFYLVDGNYRPVEGFPKGTTYDDAKQKAINVSNRHKRSCGVARVMFEVKVERKTTYDMTSEEV